MCDCLSEEKLNRVEEMLELAIPVYGDIKIHAYFSRIRDLLGKELQAIDLKEKQLNKEQKRLDEYDNFKKKVLGLITESDNTGSVKRELSDLLTIPQLKKNEIKKEVWLYTNMVRGSAALELGLYFAKYVGGYAVLNELYAVFSPYFLK